jgi:hypothetical protein
MTMDQMIGNDETGTQIFILLVRFEPATSVRTMSHFKEFDLGVI